MRILTLDDTAFEMNELPDEVDDLRFAVLDNSDSNNPDYFFIPLIFLESFNSPAAVIDVAGNLIRLPIDWKILIGEKEIGDLEMLNLSSLNDRGFKAFVFNPITGFLPSFEEIEIVNIYQEVKWYFPKLKFGHILTVPLTEDANSPCVYFVKETNKIPDVLSTDDLW